MVGSNPSRRTCAGSRDRAWRADAIDERRRGAKRSEPETAGTDQVSPRPARDWSSSIFFEASDFVMYDLYP
jgi:hypothetical protein